MLRLLIALLLICGVANATDLPTSTTRPMMLLTSSRLADMQAKEAASSVDYTFVKGKVDAYMVANPSYYYWYSAMAASLYQVDPTATSYRDRAIELLFDFAINTDSGAYWAVDGDVPVFGELSGDITSTQTTITLTDGSDFPVNDISYPVEYIVIDNELMTYTHRVGNVLQGVVRGVGVTSAVAHFTGAEVECASNSFGSADNYRGAARYCLLAYDWLYNDLTTQQKTDFQNKIVLWGSLWASELDAPNATGSRWYRDSDQFFAAAESLYMIGYALYGDNAYASTLFDYADALFNNYVIPTYVSDYFAGGIWGEGSDYTPGTIQHLIMPQILSRESRGLENTAVKDYISDFIQGWWHLLLPGETGVLPYEDMQGMTDNYIDIYGHYRKELTYYLEAGVTNSTDKGLARAWEEMATSHEPYETMYHGLWRLLFKDSSVVAVDPTPTNTPLDFQADGLNFNIMRTGWGDTDAAVYMYGRSDRFDHSHWEAGHYDIVDDGVFITKDLSGYGSVSYISGQTNSHNSLEIEGKNATYWSTQGADSRGDAVIDHFGHSTVYGFVQHDLKDLYNYGVDGATNQEISVDSYKRRLFFHKSSKYVIVHDYVDISNNSDCTWNGSNYWSTGQECSPRGKKLNHRFMGAVTLSNGNYSATNEGKVSFYRPLIPVAGVTRTIIEEAVTEPWLTGDWATPTEQYAYRVATESDGSGDPETFLNVLHWGDTGETMPAVTTIDETSIKGAYVDDSTTPFIATFSPDENAITSAAFSATADAGTIMYMSGFNPSADVTVDLTGANTASTTETADSAGMVVVTLASSGLTNVSLGGGAAVTPTCSDGIKNGDETGVDCGGSCASCESEPTGSAHYRPIFSAGLSTPSVGGMIPVLSR